MAEPKIKSLLERMGFADPDLKRPAHDDIIKWLDRNMEDVLMQVLELEERPKVLRTRWEPAVRQTKQGGQLFGCIDLMATTEIRLETIRVVFEAKTKMETLGELFRQLRIYQEGWISGNPVWQMPFVVVCPDDREAEIIQQQGFKFLKYDPALLNNLGGV
jgi:hypothetical protein